MDGQQPAAGDLSKVQEIYQKVLKEKGILLLSIVNLDKL